MKTIVIARKLFSLVDLNTKHELTVQKGETGELLAKRPGKPYIVIIGEKTLTIHDRKMLRYLFKIAPNEERKRNKDKQ